MNLYKYPGQKDEENDYTDLSVDLKSDVSLIPKSLANETPLGDYLNSEIKAKPDSAIPSPSPFHILHKPEDPS